MFSTLLATLLVTLLISAYGNVFIEDVMFSIMGTIYDGVENSRHYGNHYQLFILWQQEYSTKRDCNFCHSGIQDKEAMRKYTSDDRKIDYSTDSFTFPTSYNSNIPNYHINKERVLIDILKELTDMFAGIEIQLNGDSCCHIYTLAW